MKKLSTLNIAIESIPLSNEALTGVGRVVLHILEKLQKIDNNNNYYIITRDRLKYLSITNPRWNCIDHVGRFRKFKYSIRNKWLVSRQSVLEGKNYTAISQRALFRVIKIALELIDIVLFPLWLSIQLRRMGIDIYIGTSTNLYPQFFNKKIKKVFFVYDLVWKFFPGTMEYGNRMVMQLGTRHHLKKSDLLLSISESTKRDIITHLRINNKIDVLYLAADTNVFYKASNESIYKIKKKYCIEKQYILSVCTLEPRKNLESLLRAFQMIQKDNKSVQLVLVGKVGWIENGFFNLLSDLGIKEKVVITGYVPECDLAPLYTGASVFVYPSLYEGFGLPLLEAMQCGTPVVSSNNSSMPEVVGDAGILINAMSINEISGAVVKVLKNRKLAKELKQKGLARASQFSWEKTVGELLDKIIKLAG